MSKEPIIFWKTLKTSYFAAGHLDYARIRVVSSVATYWHVCDESQSTKANHIAAVTILAKERGWNGQWVMEAITDKGYIFIPVESGTCIDV